MTKLSPAMIKALQRAASRERRNFCPMPIHAVAQTALLNALDRRGFIDWSNPNPAPGDHKGVPRINARGFAAIDG